MTEPPVLLTALSEAQREQAHTRFTIIRPALEDGVTQAQVARTHNIPPSTVQRWVKRYREKGLAGLADAAVRSDKGKSRRLPPDAITLIEGLALQAPPRSAASIHRQVTAIAKEQWWKPPCYARVRQIIKGLDPALVTLAHQGAADLDIELIFSEKGVPRGRGKIERFFRSVNELFLQYLPGYAPSGYKAVKATLTLPVFEQKFRTWLVSDYHYRIHLRRPPMTS